MSAQTHHVTPRIIHLAGRDLPAQIAVLDVLPTVLLAIGRPLCPACELLDATLITVAASRPDLAVYVIEMMRPEDWAVRESVLWPRNIHASRAATPALALLQSGQCIASRQGAAPAHDLDRWLAEYLGPAATPITDGVTPDEASVLDATAHRRARIAAIKAR